MKDEKKVANPEKTEKTEKLKTVNIKGKEYVTVSERVRYFNKAYPNGKITTDIIKEENGVVLMKSIVVPNCEQPERFFTGYAREEKGKGLANTTSYIENCETSAVGRALGIMGIGVDTDIASADELKKVVNGESKEPKEAPEFKQPEAIKKEEDFDLGEDPELDAEISDKDATLSEIYNIGESKGYKAGDIRTVIEKKINKDISQATLPELKSYLELVKKTKPKNGTRI